MRHFLPTALLLALPILTGMPRAAAAPAQEWTLGVVAETGARGEILPCT